MYKYIVPILLFITSIVLPQKSSAYGTAAADIVYEHLGDSTYRFFVRTYQDCASGTEPDTVTLCFYNSCTNNTYSKTMAKWTGMIPNLPGNNCTGYKTSCDSPGSTNPGYKPVYYVTIETLPLRCNSWKFYCYLPGRNDGIRNISNPTSSPLYLEATFNSNITWNNSSAYYSAKPLPYTFKNQAFTYNNGALDPDGDSLITEIIHPQTGSSTSCSTTPSGVTYTSNSPAISIPGNPFQTNNLFQMNLTTGATSFTSIDTGRNSYAIRTKEYRNGSLMGSTTREVQVQTFSNTNIPTMNLSPGCGLTSNMNLCIGQTTNFCLDLTSQDSNAILKLSDNISIATPGATMTYYGQYTDSVRANFSWTPTAAHVGLNHLVITLLDSTCRPPGILLSYAQNISLYVWPEVYAGADTTICPNDAINLTATGGGQFTWVILPGGDPNSLNNPNIASPVATPANTSTYVATSGATSFCNNNKDTVTVTVLPTSSITSFPSASITVSPDSNIFAATQVTFTASVTGCTYPYYQWTRNGVDVANATANTYTTSTLMDNEVVACRITCADTCPAPRDTVTNSITMHVANRISQLEKQNKYINIYPNPNNGSFRVELNEKLATQKPIQLEIINTMGQVVYNERVNYSQSILVNKQREIIPGIYTLKVSIADKIHALRLVITE